MNGVKEGGREGYRESKRKRGEERTRWTHGGWEGEKSTQFGEGSINGPSNKGRVWLTLKLDELLWPLRSYLFIIFP